ncbi:hypothetical protein [Butyrivibrio sp. LC3010]|uniref:hypothetical protein n=1 Tax=Butyrivibrio sp. LC3010 TaxID=1280680 RepID=UPI0004190FEF|nr:hypothetical protein [Butyrivibrio sp. LC3010]
MDYRKILRRERNENVFNQYKNIIYVKADFECFYYNGLFVNTVNVHGSVLDIDFDTPAERKYEVAQGAVDIHLTMCDRTGAVLSNEEQKRTADYGCSCGFEIPMEIPESTDHIIINILFDGIEMYKNVIGLKEEVLL